MSQRSSKRAQLLLQLEVLQQNLGDVMDAAKDSVLIEDMVDPLPEVFNLTSEHYFHLDSSGLIQAANQSATQTLQYLNNELIALTLVDLIPLLEKKKGRESLYKFSAGYTPWTFSTPR